MNLGYLFFLATNHVMYHCTNSNPITPLSIYSIFAKKNIQAFLTFYYSKTKTSNISILMKDIFYSQKILSHRAFSRINSYLVID